MKAQFSYPLRIGVLGGGQLARMLCLDGAAAGFEMHVLCLSDQDPAAQVTAFWTQGNPHKQKDLNAFFKKVDVVTLESEFYSGDQLALAESTSQTPCFPEPAHVQILQDRLQQKNWLAQNHIPTSPFYKIDTNQELFHTFDKFPKGLVLKKRRGGYDGYGTFILKTEKDLKKFINNSPVIPNTFIAEAYVPFRRELAMMFFRSPQNQIVHYPLVQTEPKDNRLDVLMGPIQHKKQKDLIQKIKLALKKMNYVGAMGIELFDTGTELSVNEIAPRVHNSGHYSQAAMDRSQFVLHLQCVLDLHLSEPQLLCPHFVMTNLIGQGNSKLQIPTNLRGQLHWYGKVENKRGRKMGHINYIGSTQKSLRKLALTERKKLHL